MRFLPRLKGLLLLVLILLGFSLGQAQPPNPLLLSRQWDASWIAPPGIAPQGYGIYHFRKTVRYLVRPSRCIVHVSGDNRYKLWVNDSLVSMGPARSDLNFWNYETVDLAPYLKQGNNTLSALVWNDGQYRPEGQISNRTGFLLQADQPGDSALNTNPSWKCQQNLSYKPLTGIGYPVYYVAGPGEFKDMNLDIQGWASPEFDDSAWPAAATLGWGGALPKGQGDINGWMLVPSSLPQMELQRQRFPSLRSSSGVQPPAAFPGKPASFVIPAATHAVLLLDQSSLTNAYLTLFFSGGRNAQISLRYAESLFMDSPSKSGYLPKGNRDQVAGKYLLGRKDSILSSGASHQQFTTLSWRTFRYVELVINTAGEALELEDCYSTFTGYPFTLKASLISDHPLINTMLGIGWHTARLCAMETYMDCPYYEQLQYIGDSRIQALVSFYNSGDDRLVRNALNQMDHSRMAEGITLSRHPSFSPQQIPTFSLWYIGMLHDFYRYRGDPAFVAEKLQGVRNVLWFFRKYQQSDGRLKNVPYWLFTDWVDNQPGWSNGTAPCGKDGTSSVLDLQLLWALQLAADLEASLGSAAYAAQYASQAQSLQRIILNRYWDGSRQLMADTDEKEVFSQHANALAILTGTVKGRQATALARRILADSSLAPASIYFKYYLHLACSKAGLGNEYLSWLGAWEKNIALGLTTWAEMPNISESRSDCHAWGASPNIEFFRLVLGIDSDAPGFKRVKIEPHLGSISHISGSIPHPTGEIQAGYQLEKGRWKISITLPKKVTGRLLWKAKSYPLQPGINHLDLL